MALTTALREDAASFCPTLPGSSCLCLSPTVHFFTLWFVSPCTARMAQVPSRETFGAGWDLARIPLTIVASFLLPTCAFLSATSFVRGARGFSFAVATTGPACYAMPPACAILAHRRGCTLRCALYTSCIPVITCTAFWFGVLLHCCFAYASIRRRFLVYRTRCCCYLPAPATRISSRYYTHLAGIPLCPTPTVFNVLGDMVHSDGNRRMA